MKCIATVVFQTRFNNLNNRFAEHEYALDKKNREYVFIAKADSHILLKPTAGVQST